MMRVIEGVWLGVFLLGMLVVGVFGTWTETAPFWYGAGLIAIAGAGSVIRKYNGGIGPASRLCLWTMLATCAYLGWRALTSDVAWLARQDLVFGATGFIAWLLVSRCFVRTGQRAAILTTLALLILASTAVGSYQYFRDPTFNSFFWLGLHRAPEKSAGGFFESANHLCGFLELAAFPLLGIALLSRANAAVRVACGLTFAAAGYLVSISTSRGGFVGFATGCVVFGVLLVWVLLRRRARRSGRTVGPWLVTALFIAGAAMIAVASLKSLNMAFKGGAWENMNMREVMWRQALEQWQESPITGTGARSYEYYARSYNVESPFIPWSPVDIDPEFAHNDVFQTLGDYGLAGLLVVLTVLGAHCLNGLRTVLRATAPSGRRDSHGAGAIHAAVATGALASMAALAVHSFADFNLHVGANVVFTGIALGFLANAGRGRPDPAAPADTTDAPIPRWPVIATAVLTAALSAWILRSAIRLAPADYEWRKGRREVIRAFEEPDPAAAAEKGLRATVLLQSAAEKDPLNFHAFHFLGLCYAKLASDMNGALARSFYQEALKYLLAGYELYPQNAKIATRVAQMLDYVGRSDEAAEYHNQAARWGPSLLDVQWLRADHYRLTGDFRTAYLLYSNLLRRALTPDDRKIVGELIQECLKRIRQAGQTPPPNPTPPAGSPPANGGN